MRPKPADSGHEWISARIHRGRDAQCHLRMQRKPPAWKFLSRLLAEHLRKPGMCATACQGPHGVAQRTAPRGIAMEGTGLREQLGRVAHEYLLLRRTLRNPALSSMLAGPFRSGAAIWIQAGSSPPQREEGPHRDRHETRRPHGGGQAHGDGFSNGPRENDCEVSGPGGSFRSGRTDDVRRRRPRLPVDPWRARCLCDGRIVLRVVRCKAAGSDRELVCGHAGGQKLRAALPATIADLAELTAALPRSLQKFLAAKYGITP